MRKCSHNSLATVQKYWYVHYKLNVTHISVSGLITFTEMCASCLLLMNDY